MAHVLIPVLGSRRDLEEESVAKKMKMAAAVLEPKQKSLEQQKSWNALQSRSKTVHSSSYTDRIEERLPRSPNRSSNHEQSHNRRGLTAEQREAAAVMRLIGACSNCRNLKMACDPGTPCRPCLVSCQEGVTLSCRGIVVQDNDIIYLSNGCSEVDSYLDKLYKRPGQTSVSLVSRPSHLADIPDSYQCLIGGCGIVSDNVIEHEFHLKEFHMDYFPEGLLQKCPTCNEGFVFHENLLRHYAEHAKLLPEDGMHCPYPSWRHHDWSYTREHYASKSRPPDKKIVTPRDSQHMCNEHSLLKKASNNSKVPLPSEQSNASALLPKTAPQPPKSSPPQRFKNTISEDCSTNSTERVRARFMALENRHCRRTQTSPKRKFPP